MSARDLLHDMLGAGFALEVADGKLLVTPASSLTDELRASLRQCKPELIALLTATSQQQEPAPEPQDRPYRLTREQGDAAHAEPWDDAAIARFQARVQRLARLGISDDDADDLAERLHLRDVQGDGKRMSVEYETMALNQILQSTQSNRT